MYVLTIVDSPPLTHLIATHLQVALNTAIPAASLCINRRLYHIASISSVTQTRSDVSPLWPPKVLFLSMAQKRRGIIIDLLIGVGIPILGMIVCVYISGRSLSIY
jgi:pheromone a factor receptor